MSEPIIDEDELRKLMEKSESELTVEEKQILHNYWYQRECRFCKLNGSCQQLNLYGCPLFEEYKVR